MNNRRHPARGVSASSAVSPPRPAKDAQDWRTLPESLAIEHLANLLWRYFGSQSQRLREAVGSLAMNRARSMLEPSSFIQAKNPHYFPAATVLSCLSLEQEFRQVQPISTNEGSENLGSRDPRLRGTESCRRTAGLALRGALPDVTRGACFLHPEGDLPTWTRGLNPSLNLGGYWFYPRSQSSDQKKNY